MKIPSSYPTWVSDGSPIEDVHGRGDRAVRFFNALRHPKAEGRKFVLPEFWERILQGTYGPSDEYGNRLVRTVFIMIPRGARKTTIGAGLGLLHSFGHEKVPGGTCILAAGAEDQAQLAFDEAKAFALATPGLDRAAHIVESELELTHRASGSILRAIPAEGDVQHGKTPHFVLVDELHVWRNRKLWRALKTGLLKVPNTLLVIITTAGRGTESLAYEEYRYARSIAEGKIVNPAYLPIIFEPPEGADWRSEKLWHLVNPGLKQGFPDLIGMRQAALEAQDKPGDRDDFKNYNLNFWLDGASSPFVDMARYDEGGEQIDLEALRDQPCWLGVDLSSTTDLSVIVAAWRDPDNEGGYVVHPWFFCPRANLREREDRTGAPYVRWEAEGLITATPGDVIDDRALEACIREQCEAYDVREIAFDPALARSVMNNLNESGLPVVVHRQGALTMMPALAELERSIVGRKLRHGGHAVLRFCIANAEAERNRQGHLVRLVKPQKWLSIDGAVAAAMAVGRAAMGDDQRSIYSDERARPGGLLVF